MTEQTAEQTAEQTTEETTDPTTTGWTGPNTRIAVALLALHAALCVFWAILGGKPSKDWSDLPFAVIMSINYAFINPVITVVTGVAFWIQASETGTIQDGTALSRKTPVLQIMVFLALVVLWPFRLRLPQNLKGSSLWLLFDWYPLVGWACVNNALVVVGQCIVLYAFDGIDRSGARFMSRETQPLLST